MMTTTTFPLTKLQRLRERTAKLVRTPLFGPERWSKSVVDPMKVLAVFKKCLWIKKGYVLRAYLFREDGKSDGIVWAMPADADFPNPSIAPSCGANCIGLPNRSVPWTTNGKPSTATVRRGPISAPPYSRVNYLALAERRTVFGTHGAWGI